MTQTDTPLILRGSSAISRHLGLSSANVRRLSAKGLLPTYKEGGRWVLIPGLYDAMQQARALAFLRREAEVGTHPAAPHQSESERSLTPGRGVATAPRAHGSRIAPYKKEKGLDSQPVDNKGISGGDDSPQLVSLNQGDAVDG